MVALNFLFWLSTKLAPGQVLAAFGVPADVQEKLSVREKALNFLCGHHQEIHTVIAGYIHSTPPNGDS